MDQPTTMDAAAKERVKAALLAQAQQALEGLTGQVSEDHSASEIDQSDVFSVDDLSQADEAGDLGGLFEQSLARQEALVKQIEELDFAPTDVVAPGALVGFGGGRFVVGVVADEFECDGVTYEGISADSPVFAQIEGLRAGDEFTAAERSHRIDFVA